MDERNELCCSDNEELYFDDCASIDGAIEIAQENGWDYVYVGEKVSVTLADLVHQPSVRILEWAAERASELVGEAAENWIEPTNEQTAELDLALVACVTAWANEHSLQPTFYRVINMSEHDVPEVKE